jgi:hypothetical protein
MPTFSSSETQAGEQKVALTNNVVVWALPRRRCRMSKGAFIGVGATPQTDGTQV